MTLDDAIEHALREFGNRGRQMSNRPSDGFGLDELRDEYDWMYEFDSRMAERITGDADVHNLADYVSKLETENERLRKWASALAYAVDGGGCDLCPYELEHDACGTENIPMRDGCRLYEEMRKLGLEVER